MECHQDGNPFGTGLGLIWQAMEADHPFRPILLPNPLIYTPITICVPIALIIIVCKNNSLRLHLDLGGGIFRNRTVVRAEPSKIGNGWTEGAGLWPVVPVRLGVEGEPIYWETAYPSPDTKGILPDGHGIGA